ncbi:MAG: class I SAM-dependent DNA methyltransferase, partial [Candidatus Riflebacteria bacterium]|nr:class I SAM-dependent DNA methyltransferase [Candidatus Riflebacteria bacterium]
ALKIDWQELLIPISTIDVTAQHANIYLVNDPKQTYDTINVQTKSFKVHKGQAPAKSERVSFDYIMGNPPFIGKNYRSDQQDTDLHKVFNTAASLEPVKLYRSLDFVAAWYYLATDYLVKNKNTRVAFVSTNSITQGEQVSILWPPLIKAGLKIHFAHRTFSWSSEARGKAAVHLVIIGFGLADIPEKTLFVYDDIKGEPHSTTAKNINPYLLNAPNAIVLARSQPLCKAPEIINGSKPTDGGNLLLSEKEKDELLAKEPPAEQFIRPFVGAEEFINNIPRFCFWLVNCSPNQLRSMPLVLSRIEAVKRMREASSDATTRKDSATPTLFQKIRQPQSNYLLIPSVSSENRQYIPIGYMTPETIVSNLVYAIPDAELYHFGILSSKMHNSWMRAVSGRLKSDYRYSANISYNTFPWPTEPTIMQQEKVSVAAQQVLEARARYPESSLADLYDPRSMTPELVKAHQNLDKAVDAAYGKTTFKTEADRVAFLFELYQQLTAKKG